MVSPEKVATPLAAVTVSVPPTLTPAGLLTVTLPVKVLTTVPKPSSAVTAKPKLLPAAMLSGGCAVTTSCVATPAGVTLMAVVVADVRPVAVACEGVAATRCAEGQAGEGGHAVDRGHGERSSQRGGTARIVRQGHRHVARRKP